MAAIIRLASLDLGDGIDLGPAAHTSSSDAHTPRPATACRSQRWPAPPRPHPPATRPARNPPPSSFRNTGNARAARAHSATSSIVDKLGISRAASNAGAVSGRHDGYSMIGPCSPPARAARARSTFPNATQSAPAASAARPTSKSPQPFASPLTQTQMLTPVPTMPRTIARLCSTAERSISHQVGRNAAASSLIALSARSCRRKT